MTTMAMPPVFQHPQVRDYFNRMGQAYGFNPHDPNTHGPVLGQMQQAALQNPQARDSILNHFNALSQYGNYLRGQPVGAGNQPPVPKPLVQAPPSPGGTGGLFPPPRPMPPVVTGGPTAITGGPNTMFPPLTNTAPQTYS